MDKVEIKNNQLRHRFEARLHGEVAQLDYVMVTERLVAYVHTEVPPNLQGKGVGTDLAKYALDYARKQTWRVIPICPFVADYVQKHPEYNDIISNVTMK